MAQTRRKRRSKHRGTPAGTIETRGRTGRKPRPEERKAAGSGAPRGRRNRFDQQPTWRSAAGRAGVAAGIFLAAVIAVFRQNIAAAISAENCFVLRRDEADRGLVVDPGDEPDRILATVDELGIGVDAILLTHTHFDHVGAVAPVARATGAPVYCPRIEVPVLADIMSYVPWPGFGPFESYDADETVAGGERLQLAGFDLDVMFVPGHSPGHVAYSIADEEALFSGDVIFQGSVGRTDLPGGDWPTLARSIATLVDALPAETRVHPGHMGLTTLGQEAATNPFLREIAAQR